jgi:hypothetical protein
MQSTVREITINLTIAATALAMITMTDITAARADASKPRSSSR